MNRAKRVNPEMEGKTDLQVEVEDPKMWILHQDSQGPLQEGTETVPLKEEAVPCTMECPPKAAEPVEDEGESFMAVAVVTGAPTQQVQDLLVAVGVEWEAGLEETIAHQLVAAMSRNPKVREQVVADMVRIGLSTTLPEPEIAVKLAVRVQSMKKFPKGEGREDQKLAARVLQVTLATQTKKKARNPTQKMAQIMPTPQAAGIAHLYHPEVPRPVSSRPGECPQEGAEVVEVVGEIFTGVVAIWEELLGGTELDPTQPHMGLPPNHQLQTANSKVRHKPQDRKTLEGEETQQKRRTR